MEFYGHASVISVSRLIFYINTEFCRNNYKIWKLYV